MTLRAHELIFRFPDPLTGEGLARGEFERIEGGWVSRKTNEFYPDTNTLRARNLVFGEGAALTCDVCGETAKSPAGLAHHKRFKHVAK